jgi:hypothetical protein
VWAYSFLKPDKRREYDAALRAARSRPNAAPQQQGPRQREDQAATPPPRPAGTRPVPQPTRSTAAVPKQPRPAGRLAGGIILSLLAWLIAYSLTHKPSSPGSQTSAVGTPVAEEYRKKAEPPQSTTPSYPCWNGFSEYPCSQQEYQVNLQQHLKQDGWSLHNVQVLVSACKGQASQLTGRGISEARITAYLDSYCRCLFSTFPKKFPRGPDELEKASAEVDTDGRPRTWNAKIVQGVIELCAREGGPLR